LPLLPAEQAEGFKKMKPQRGGEFRLVKPTKTKA
jgi:hypothetical protein